MVRESRLQVLKLRLLVPTFGLGFAPSRLNHVELLVEGLLPERLWTGWMGVYARRIDMYVGSSNDRYIITRPVR